MGAESAAPDVDGMTPTGGGGAVGAGGVMADGGGVSLWQPATSAAVSRPSPKIIFVCACIVFYGDALNSPAPWLSSSIFCLLILSPSFSIYATARLTRAAKKSSTKLLTKPLRLEHKRLRKP
ncbi:MAG: hypothetical protein HY300_07920 [Verrucomicrobia bacterium]|nr:hypothetical protein [Verrucomicrobiota bacterium]